MLLNVQVKFSVADGDWEVNVWDQEDGERIEYLERVFPFENDCIEYVQTLVINKKYVVNHV